MVQRAVAVRGSRLAVSAVVVTRWQQVVSTEADADAVAVAAAVAVTETARRRERGTSRAAV